MTIPSASGPSASSALSSRLPTIVASWVGGKPPHSRAPGVTCSVDAALAGGRRLAQQQRDEHGLLDPLPQAPEQVLGGRPPRCRPARSPPRCGRAPPGRRSRAGGWRPRGSGPCSASASAWTAPSSRASVSTSVRSRSVTTVPTRRPSRSTARLEASRTRSPAISGASSLSSLRARASRARRRAARFAWSLTSAGRPCFVEDHDAFAQRVQGRVVVGVEGRDLLRLQAERLALEAAREQQAEQAADGEDHRREADQAGQQRRDLLADRVGEHADGDERDDRAVVVGGGHHGPDRAAERALRRLGHRLAAGPRARRCRRSGLPIRSAFGCE